MSNYRDLNKELVEQVQTMRQVNKLYCDEIVHLKSELMKNREENVLLRKQCYNLAVNNFMHLAQCLQPDSDILPLLKEHINVGKDLISTERGLACSTKRSDARKRSTLLTREFRRSSTVISLRQSVCSSSPVRSYESNSEEEEHTSQIMASDVEENAEIAAADAAPNEIPHTTNIDTIIYEESEEEEEEEIYDCDDSVCESVEEVSVVHVTEKRCNLNDITNLLQSTKISTKEQNVEEKIIIKKRIPTKRTKKKIMSGKENSSEEYTTSKEDSDNDIAKNKTRGQKAFAQKSYKPCEEETLQEPRGYSNSRYSSDTNKSFPLNQNHGHLSRNEVTLNSPTLVLNDMTLKNFTDAAACSTPNSRQNSLESATTIHSETSTAQTSANTSSRPSRRCKPVNLTEQKLTGKLRNESETKPRKYRKSKPKK